MNKKLNLDNSSFLSEIKMQFLKLQNDLFMVHHSYLEKFSKAVLDKKQ